MEEEKKEAKQTNEFKTINLDAITDVKELKALAYDNMMKISMLNTSLSHIEARIKQLNA